MSFVLSTQIICDGARCDAFTKGIVGKRIRRVHANRQARELKWTTYLNKHYCPECTKKIRETRLQERFTEART